MDSARLKITENNILQSLTEMMDRTNMAKGYINRVVYNTYKRRQRKRWMTQSESEAKKWEPLNPKYESYKKRKFASFPGSGTKMMIATQRLFNAVVGDNDKSEHRKIIEGKTKLIVGWTTPYAVYTEKVRPVSEWDPKQDKKMYDDFVKYLMNGIMPIVTGE